MADTHTAAVRTQQRHTDEDIAETLATLAQNGGNVERTAADTGIPASTIRHWRDADHRTVPPELVEQRKRERAARWDELQDAAVTQALAKIGEASARDAAVVAGIATDKANELRGGGAGAQAEDPARLALFRARYAASQQLQVTVHVHTGPAPEPPLVPVTVVENAVLPGDSQDGEAK